MTVDTSAIIAILKGEPEADNLVDILTRDPSEIIRMSCASYIEAGILVDSAKDPVISRKLDQLINELQITLIPVTELQAQLARDAYRDFGKGSGHPAGLNFGDVFSYALAKEYNDTLLYKGNDFAKTDIDSAMI